MSKYFLTQPDLRRVLHNLISAPITHELTNPHSKLVIDLIFRY